MPLRWCLRVPALPMPRVTKWLRLSTGLRSSRRLPLPRSRLGPRPTRPSDRQDHWIPAAAERGSLGRREVPRGGRRTRLGDRTVRCIPDHPLHAIGYIACANLQFATAQGIGQPQGPEAERPARTDQGKRHGCVARSRLRRNPLAGREPDEAPAEQVEYAAIEFAI